MARNFAVSILALLPIAVSAQAVLEGMVFDEFDDPDLIRAVCDHKAVRVFRKDLDKVWKKLLAKKEGDIERLFGKPAAWSKKTYALPVAEPRDLVLSGLVFTGSKRHYRFYAIQDFAAAEVYYGHDGETPEAIVIYLKVDKDFLKLTKTNLQKRLDWDRERFTKLVTLVEPQE
jgi:hypothetical protein